MSTPAVFEGWRRGASEPVPSPAPRPLALLDMVLHGPDHRRGHPSGHRRPSVLSWLRGGERVAVTRLLTLAESAEVLRVSVRTVQRLIASGQLRAVHIGRRTLLTDRELEVYVAAAYRRAA